MGRKVKIKNGKLKMEIQLFRRLREEENYYNCNIDYHKNG